jgi:hypothetical protein
VIYEGNVYGGNLPKTFIITGIIFLILYVFLVWDDEEDHESNAQDEDVVFVPKYKIANKLNIRENSTDKKQILDTKQIPDTKQADFTIQNKYNNKFVKDNTSNGQENSNIFISNKNKSKFGIKF